MKLRAAMVLCMALVASGCASTSKVMLGPARPAISPEQVQVYYTPPPGRYDEIALLEASSGGLTYGEQNKMTAVIGRRRAAAAEPGANGVVFQGTARGYSGSSIGVGVGSGSFGGRSYTSGGVGVNVSPSPKLGAGIALYVYEPQRPAHAPPPVD